MVVIRRVAKIVGPFILFFVNYTPYYIAKVSSRCKHLQCYQGNWTTLEIMKTFLKNRHAYKHRIESPE